MDIAFPSITGKQTTTAVSKNTLTVTGGYTNTTTYDTNTGIYGGYLTVTLDERLTPVNSKMVLTTVTAGGGTKTVTGSYDKTAHTVTFYFDDSTSLLVKGDACEYSIVCSFQCITVTNPEDNSNPTAQHDTPVPS